MLRPSNGPGDQLELPKEAEIAAENTFIKVLETFDALLTDTTRWNLETQKDLANRFKAAHDLNLKYLAEQARFAADMNTPHFKYKPNLMRLRDGRVLAIVGNVDDLDNAICGVGASAQEALKLFDETFDHGAPLHLIEYMKQREEALARGEVPPPCPIKTPPSSPEPETKTPRKKKSK